MTLQNAFGALALDSSLAAILAKLTADPATQTTLASVLTQLSTGATSLLKAEDSASAGGDRGVSALHLRGLTTPTAHTDTPGDYSSAIVDAEGKQIVSFGAIPENTWQASLDLTTTTATALKAAAGTGLRNYLKTLFISTTAATTPAAHTLQISDGTTRVGLVRLPAASVTGQLITFDPPLRGSANTALNLAMSVATGTDSVTATGYVGI